MRIQSLPTVPGRSSDDVPEADRACLAGAELDERDLVRRDEQSPALRGVEREQPLASAVCNASARLLSISSTGVSVSTTSSRGMD
jgi:hypothetical protein